MDGTVQAPSGGDAVELRVAGLPAGLAGRMALWYFGNAGCASGDCQKIPLKGQLVGSHG